MAGAVSRFKSTMNQQVVSFCLLGVLFWMPHIYAFLICRIWPSSECSKQKNLFLLPVNDYKILQDDSWHYNGITMALQDTTPACGVKEPSNNAPQAPWDHFAQPRRPSARRERRSLVPWQRPRRRAVASRHQQGTARMVHLSSNERMFGKIGKIMEDSGRY